MDLEKFCLVNKGKYNSKDKSCRLPDGKLFYDTTQTKCLSNGDSWETLKYNAKTFHSCREVDVEEFCKRKGKPDIRHCFQNIKLPNKKISQAIEKGKNLWALYRNQKLTPQQIDKAIEKGEELWVLYARQKLTPQQINKAIEKGKELETLYYRQKLTPQQIDKAIEKGEHLWTLYEYQKLTPQQIDKAIEKGELLWVIYTHQKLTPQQIDKAIEKGESLGTLYTHQKLTPQQIDKAMEKGGEYLWVLYDRQKLTPQQIDKAIEKGEELDILFSYQKPSPKQIQYAIDHNIALEFLYSSPLTTKEQKAQILQKLGVKLTPEQMESPLWRAVPPTKILKAVKAFNKSIENKIKENPLKDLTGVYPIKASTFTEIRDYLNKRNYYIKGEDLDYAYYIDKQGIERKIRIGKLLKNEPELLKRYTRLKQFGKPKENLEIVISQNPEDIARKSTGQRWTSCETIGGSYGFPPKCGWCDDIKANNLIAYIREKDNPKWIGRVMIRWCIRKDDEKPDAVVERYYGNHKYADILRNNLINILREKGYSAIFGNVLCKTPYNYTGYIDSGTRCDTNKICYEVGDRPSQYLNI